MTTLTSKQPRVFWYHYNKPASQKAGEMRLSLHYQNRCIIVGHIWCMAPAQSQERKTQPKCVMRGATKKITIHNDTATIY